MTKSEYRFINVGTRQEKANVAKAFDEVQKKLKLDEKTIFQMGWYSCHLDATAVWANALTKLIQDILKKPAESHPEDETVFVKPEDFKEIVAALQSENIKELTDGTIKIGNRCAWNPEYEIRLTIDGVYLFLEGTNNFYFED